MLLSELSQVQDMGVEVLAEVLKRSKLLQSAQFREEGTDFLHTPLGERSQPGFRPKNGSYSPEDDNPSPTAAELAFLGKEAIIDRSYKIDAEKGLVNLDHYMRGLLMQRAKAFGEGFDKQSFSADGTSNSTAGFGALIPGGSNVTGYNTTMTLNADTDALDTSTTAGQDTLLELLDETLEEVPNANAIHVNRKMSARLTTIARNKHALDYEVNEFGVRVTLFNGVPIIPLADGAIPANEVDGVGGDDDTTSIYIARWDEWNGVTFASNNGFEYIDFANLEASVVSKARMEMRYKPLIDAEDAIRRIRYIKL